MARQPINVPGNRFAAPLAGTNETPDTGDSWHDALEKIEDTFANHAVMGEDARAIVVLTAAAYGDLAEPDATTLYVVTGESSASIYLGAVPIVAAT